MVHTGVFPFLFVLLVKLFLSMYFILRAGYEITEHAGNNINKKLLYFGSLFAENKFDTSCFVFQIIIHLKIDQ